MRRLVELAVDRIVAHIESLPSQPSVDVEGGVELARSLSEPLPETPTPYAQLLDLLFERAVPKSFNTAGPGYLAYIPGGGLCHPALADRAAGRTPFLVVGTAGTTNTGAVDDLAALADLAGTEGLWLHVDAAYGGFILLTERGRRIMRGIERADSVTLDPHKGLFLPYGTGALVVRDGGALRRAHGMHADYLPALPPESDLIDFSEVSPELSRPFRGLRVWLPLK